MKTFFVYFAAAIGLLLAVNTIAGGSRLFGIRYGVSVNNLSDFPDTVASVDGRTLTLADGRSFKLDRGTDAGWLAAELERAENVVAIDLKRGVLYGRSRIGYCSFDRPQRLQLVTIPIVRVDLPVFCRREIAHLAAK